MSRLGLSGGGGGGAPSGAAGGVLGGTYPNTSFATTVAANLVMGAGKYIGLSGTTVDGAAVPEVRLGNAAGGLGLLNAAGTQYGGTLTISGSNTVQLASNSGALVLFASTSLYLGNSGQSVLMGGPCTADSSVSTNPYGVHGRAAIAMSDADNTPTAGQYANTIMEFTGTLTAGRNVILPTKDGYYKIVYNNTTGGFALTFKTSGGTGVAVAAGKRALVYCDNTNIVRVTPDT